MLMNLSDDWAESDEELNFASESANDYLEKRNVSGLEFATSSGDEKMTFATSSSDEKMTFATSSGDEKMTFATSSGDERLMFATLSSGEFGTHSSALDFATSESDTGK